MLRNPSRDVDVPFLLEQLKAGGEDAPPLEEKLRLAQAIRSHSRESGQQLDRFFLEEIDRVQGGIAEAREIQGRLKDMIDRLTAVPWYPATFLSMAWTPRGSAAMVSSAGSRRVVGLSPDVDAESLAVGDEVLLLGHEQNVVMCRSLHRQSQGGETASFERLTPDGRMVLRWRDEQVVVAVAQALHDASLTSGDQVRWDRSLWMAFEKIERPADSSLFLDEMPTETFDRIGGLHRQIRRLQRRIRGQFEHPHLTRKYGLRPLRSVLLVGPPGTGKTMIARALANWLGTLSGTGRARFMDIKPASLHSMWYSQSEANYREAFRVAREAGAGQPDVPVVMFFDEVDSIGSARGASLMRVDDRVLTALMTELDGMRDRGNILVVAATNRMDVLDPALLRPGRLGDLVLDVPRPDRAAARDIFAKHLGPDREYEADGRDQAGVRDEVIEAAVSQIYAPNSDNAVATLTFRDGRRCIVTAPDLMNGARIAKIAEVAAESARDRDIDTQRSGIRADDVLLALAEELRTAARGLTPANCHHHIGDLPQDIDVVRVEPVQRKVTRAYRYLNVA